MLKGYLGQKIISDLGPSNDKLHRCPNCNEQRLFYAGAYKGKGQDFQLNREQEEVKWI